MNPQIWWYIARASGFVAWGLLSGSVISGLLVSTRITHGRPTAAWLVDLHRFLAGAGVAFTALHLGGLVADGFVQFGPADLLVPFASAWKPIPVALGIVSLYLVTAVEVSSLLMRRLPRRWWKRIHLASFGLFWSATFHLLLAGSDATNPVAQWAEILVVATVVFLTLVRILAPRGRRGPPPVRTAARVSQPV
jgi:DMSO/TMAO reductase YedYZ heme-binding membrane subunit